ncbi:type I polyketide synthase [Lentzea sp. NBRC 105346]|uniref:beta-ketoacyl synthase N-terminal-like domain-containing protein n=1 Tax=Lentzea sp. NBRC 105346 TaxID=3032205 RepID=UPI0024A2BC4A|nr:beta-ketoacyl synthase N-terminal-like domain-containing protein [Lentzea sp. NBRC 105346]GLZ28831.1 type I polyketide synthase [Lentzea sp. NBRC 105346]
MFEPIAIVGRGCVLPDAVTPEAFWHNVSTGRMSLTAVPDGRWRLPHWWAIGTPEDSADRTWSDIGGYVHGVEFAGLGDLDPLFQWTLHSAREALREAGTTGRTGLVLGNLSFPSAGLSRFAESVWLDQERPDARNRFSSGLPALLTAEMLGLDGAFALDAACASSLYAIKLACDRLHDRTADVMLAGGVSCADDLFIHTGFCALSALSPSGRSRPLHRLADGLVPAEGAAMLTLMRLDDAVAQDRKIFGVIRGIGLSNDGRSGGLLAPAEDGQERAMRAAYAAAGVAPESVSLVECHATGTPVGDAIEMHSMARVFANATDLPIGSVKSNVGHLITAAGAAGVLKVLGAMASGMRPATLSADDPLRALHGTPMRVLHEAEEWTGPRRAGVSAFGFGGNNAHLIIDEWTGDRCYEGTLHSGQRLESSPHSTRSEVAIVAIAARVGDGRGTHEFEHAVLQGSTVNPRRENVEVALEGLRFPPKDLEHALPQQLLIMQAAREVVHGLSLPRDRTMILAGMGCDAEVARYGARWRVASWLQDENHDVADNPEELARFRDAFIPSLTAPGVLGTMPNIVANRLNAQLDLAGPSFAVSAEEASGIEALRVATRAVATGEVDAAVVGAVDLSCEPVHAEALRALGVDKPAGDAAVVLVLKRVSEAEQVLAIIDDTTPDLVLSSSDVVKRFGSAHAAEGLLGVATAAVALSRRAELRAGEPAGPALAPQSAEVVVSQLGGEPHRVGLRAGSRKPWLATVPPRPYVYSGPDVEGVLAALEASRESDTGPARLVILASSAAEHATRAQAARQWLTGRGIRPEGVAFRARPIGGELGFVYTNGSACYPDMGRELMLAFPDLLDEIAARCGDLPSLVGWAYRGAAPATVLDQIWGASVLGQLHTGITRDLLGLSPSAVLAYSSGESTSLVSMGVWRDVRSLVADASASPLFTTELAGPITAVRRVWERLGVPGSAWRSYMVSAPVEAVRAALADEPAVHLMAINSPDSCVVGGESTACQRVLAAFEHTIPIDYDIAVHAPEVAEVRSSWWELHRREIFDVPGVRFYSGASGVAYTPSPSACADAITSQALDTIDFVRVVENAWNDGVRVFVEHGPRGLCTGWIQRILGDREHVAVALDATDGLRQLLRSVADLMAAGVPVDSSRFFGHLASIGPRVVDDGPHMLFPAHRPPVRLPERGPRVQEMPRAPWLPPVPALAAPVAPAPAPAPAPVSVPVPVPQFVDASRAAVIMEQQRVLNAAHAEFIATQAAVHEQFLRGRELAAAVLLRRVGIAPAGTALPGTAPAGTAPAGTAPTDIAQADIAPAGAPPAGAAPAGADMLTQASPSLGGPPISIIPADTDSSGASQRSVDNSRSVAPKHVDNRKPGPKFDRAQLEHLAEHRISDLFGKQFEPQDQYARQTRMPMSPMLLADRVTGIAAEPARMGTGTIWTETDVTNTAWYLDPTGRMPAGIMIEAGQADLLLISWLGADLLNRGERIYRLLGCELTYHGELPKPGETLEYEITIDGHGEHDGIRLFFFHYDCYVDGELRLSVRNGQAGFFTDEELANTGGVIWDEPQIQTTDVEPHTPPAWHTRTPTPGNIKLFDKVTDLKPKYIRTELPIHEDDWFFEGHFKNDPCMPGTLMFEGCLQSMAQYLIATGRTHDKDGWRFEPAPGNTIPMRCRGQVTPQSQNLIYEVFVKEETDTSLKADVLCTVDGVKAFLAENVQLNLKPDWPLKGRTTPFKFDEESLMACAWGKPSDAFGPSYAVFDGERKCARLPGPPYHFMTRIKETRGPQNGMQLNSEVTAEYDVPDEAWYFEDGTMPFGVLMEVVLQPCGWLASYVGSSLTTEQDLLFRNLDGTGTVHKTVTPKTRFLTTKSTITQISRSAGMIIESFTVECHDDQGDLVFDLKTVFGYFPPEAFDNQVGLPTDEEQLEDNVRHEIPQTMLTMIDRVTGYWPDDGKAGLGRIRSEKDVDPDDWFFKAHFFSDPVQPGSLGVEAMLQLLGFHQKQSPCIRTGKEITWKYRGQVTPKNKVIRIELELTGDGEAEAWLWADDKRIYHATNLALGKVFDAQKQTWLQDHRPTWTVPALPMMSTIDLIAGDATALRDVTLHRWVPLDGPVEITTTHDNDQVTLFASGKKVATAHKAPIGERPEPFPKIRVRKQPDPYEAGILFHGPAFRYLTDLRTGPRGASATLDAGKGSVPPGRLGQGVLDAATHVIPHDAHPDRVGFPHRITSLEVFEPLPESGLLQVEARWSGDEPVFDVQIQRDGRVLAAFRLVDVLLPKGRLGSAQPRERRAFLEERKYAGGLGLSTTENGRTTVTAQDVEMCDWLPGTVAAVYGLPPGARGVDHLDEIAVRDHLARALKVHPCEIMYEPERMMFEREQGRVTTYAKT